MRKQKIPSALNNMKRPLVVLAFIFSLGILIASHIKISFVLVYSLTIIFLILSFMTFKKRIIFDTFLSCLILLFAITSLKNHNQLPNCHIYKYTSYKNNCFYTIKGFLNSQPVLKINQASFIFKAQQIQFDNLRHNCCGNILVYVKARNNFHYGEELILSGNLHRPYSFGRAAGSSYKNYLYNQGIYSILHVSAVHPIIRLNKNQGLAIKRFALWLKVKMEEVIFKYVSSLAAGVLDAMVLGERRNIPVFINNSMIKSGTVHILVVSGFNVGIVTLMVQAVLKLFRLPRKIRFYVAVPILIIYCLLTGASTPVVRATIMAAVFLFAYLVKKEPDIYNSCAISAIFILGINPRQLFDIGFQLSFVSVLSIVFLYPKIKSALRLESIKIKYLKFIIDGGLVSFSAWVGTLGFIAHYFKIFSPITVLANIVIVPLAALITLSGFSLIIIGMICPPVAQLFAHTNELLVAILLKINSVLIKLPGAYWYLS